MHTVKPLDHAMLERIVRSHSLIATIEEHSRIGGFGSAVSEWLSDLKKPGPRLLRFGTKDSFLHEATNQSHARERLGLTVDNIVEDILKSHSEVSCESN